MKVKSILASLGACAIAFSAMAISASAEVTNGTETGNDGKKFWMYDVAANTSDITQVYGFEVKITPADTAMPNGCGGGMGMNSTSTGWKSAEWGNPDSGKAVIIDTDNWTLKYVNDTAFAATDEYAQVWVQSWWGCDLTVDSVKLLDKDGNEIGAAPAQNDQTDAPANDNTTATQPAATQAANNNTTAAAGAKTGDAGVGIAVGALALAGVAAVVTRKKH